MVKLKTWVKVVLFLIIILVLIILYGFFIGNKGFIVKEKEINADFKGLKIVQFSDLEYGNTIHKYEINKIVDKINLIKPDILIFTGDLIYENNKEDLKPLKKALKKINCKLDAFFINGENDNENSTSILTSANFIDLNNNNKVYNLNNNNLLIAGISDMNNSLETTYNYLKDNKAYSILIMHNPSKIKKVELKKFNLVLAGHTHGGYIKVPYLGGIILPKDNLLNGKDNFKKGKTQIYVSNGLGNEEINFRLFNKPSITLFRLRKAKDK